MKYFLVLLIMFCVASCSKDDENNSQNTGPCSGFTAPYASNTGPVEIGQSIQLTADTDEPDVSFDWTGPNGFNSSKQNPVISNASFEMNGTYFVKISNAQCTSSNSSTYLTINAPCGTIATNAAVVGTQTWNFNSAVSCGNSGTNSHYKISGTYGSNSLEINFNKLNKPDGYVIYAVDGTGNPSFDSTKVQMKISESGTIYTAISGNVYVGNHNDVLTAAFCGIIFTNTLSGISKPVKTKIICD